MKKPTSKLKQSKLFCLTFLHCSRFHHDRSTFQVVGILDLMAALRLPLGDDRVTESPTRYIREDEHGKPCRFSFFKRPQRSYGMVMFSIVAVSL